MKEKIVMRGDTVNIMLVVENWIEDQSDTDLDLGIAKIKKEIEKVEVAVHISLGKN